jgi:hypothetical protein
MLFLLFLLQILAAISVNTFPFAAITEIHTVKIIITETLLTVRNVIICFYFYSPGRTVKDSEYS